MDRQVDGVQHLMQPHRKPHSTTSSDPGMEAFHVYRLNML